MIPSVSYFLLEVFFNRKFHHNLFSFIPTQLSSTSSLVISPLDEVNAVSLRYFPQSSQTSSCQGSSLPKFHLSGEEVHNIGTRCRYKSIPSPSLTFASNFSFRAVTGNRICRPNSSLFLFLLFLKN